MVPVDPQLMLAALRGDQDPFQQAAYAERNNALPEIGANGIGSSAGGPLRAAPDYSAPKFTPQVLPSRWDKSINPATQTYPSERTYNAGRDIALSGSQTNPSSFQDMMMKQNVPLTYQQTIQLLRVLEKRGILGPAGEGNTYPTLVGKNKVR